MLDSRRALRPGASLALKAAAPPDRPTCRAAAFTSLIQMVSISGGWAATAAVGSPSQLAVYCPCSARQQRLVWYAMPSSLLGLPAPAAVAWNQAAAAGWCVGVAADTHLLMPPKRPLLYPLAGRQGKAATQGSGTVRGNGRFGRAGAAGGWLAGGRLAFWRQVQGSAPVHLPVLLGGLCCL